MESTQQYQVTRLLLRFFVNWEHNQWLSFAQSLPFSSSIILFDQGFRKIIEITACIVILINKTTVNSLTVHICRMIVLLTN